jgi:hypothetical protein
MSAVRAHRSALVTLCLCVFAIASCRTAGDPTPAATPSPATVVSITPPFQTKEPERYSATRIVTTVGPNGEKTVESWLIGKDGLIHRREDGSEATRTVYLDSPEGRFILWPEQKVYAVEAGDYGDPSDFKEDENSPDRLLHTDPVSSAFQLLGTETVDGRGAAKYRVDVNEGAGAGVSGSDVLIWVDNVLNMPIKTEIRSPDGSVVVTELANVTLQPDKQLFQIPPEFEKIPYSALQKQLKARRLNP